MSWTMQATGDAGKLANEISKAPVARDQGVGIQAQQFLTRIVEELPEITDAGLFTVSASGHQDRGNVYFRIEMETLPTLSGQHREGQQSPR